MTAQHLLPVGAVKLVDREQSCALCRIRVKCFARGRRVGLQPQSTLVLSGSSHQMPVKMHCGLPQTSPSPLKG